MNLVGRLKPRLDSEVTRRPHCGAVSGLGDEQEHDCMRGQPYVCRVWRYGEVAELMWHYSVYTFLGLLNILSSALDNMSPPAHPDPSF